MRSRAIITTALAIALVVARALAGPTLARPLITERRLDDAHSHETLRTLRTATSGELRPRAAEQTVALPTPPAIADAARQAVLIAAAAEAVAPPRLAPAEPCARGPPRRG